mmetsp:Transcript_36178/g.79030  ORF Transcript_36178/g.79030 Transcript_36178/m.79030 type:complete len:214 (-) Transcript_36178:136-777(-)
MPTARSRCAAAAVRGLLYVVGGRDCRQRVTAAERMDPSTGKWEPLPPMPLAPPMGCAAAALCDCIYVIGVGADREMAVERFDPGDYMWQTLPSMPRQRFGCAAATVGRSLFVVGGHDGEQAVSVCERFTVVGGLASPTCAPGWQQLPPLPTARHGGAAVSSGGMLYVVGGDDGKGPLGSLAVAERFDPSNWRWETLPPVPTGRFGCAAAAAWQ